MDISTMKLKWSKAGKEAAKNDGWMHPCFECKAKVGCDSIDEILGNARDQWEQTNHFEHYYGRPMREDAHLVADSLNMSVEGWIDLWDDCREAFWSSWEEEVGAHSLVAKLLSGE